MRVFAAALLLSSAALAKGPMFSDIVSSIRRSSAPESSSEKWRAIAISRASSASIRSKRSESFSNANDGARWKTGQR